MYFNDILLHNNCKQWVKTTLILLLSVILLVVDCTRWRHSYLGSITYLQSNGGWGWCHLDISWGCWLEHLHLDSSCGLLLAWRLVSKSKWSNRIIWEVYHLLWASLKNYMGLHFFICYWMKSHKVSFCFQGKGHRSYHAIGRVLTPFCKKSTWDGCVVVIWKSHVPQNVDHLEHSLVQS